MGRPITAEDRADFKRCRRQWDLGSPHRRNLEVASPERSPDLGRAIADALAVYYFPGMWDWPRPIVLPLAVQALVDALAEQQSGTPAAPGTSEMWQDAEQLGREALASYFAWAPRLDRFSPVQVKVDLVATVPDPDDPERPLTAGPAAAKYRAQIDLLAVDADDAYWVVQHRVAAAWAAPEQLLLDEPSVAGCWVWEDSYLGMDIVGTIHNELRLTGLEERPAFDPAGRTGPERGGLDQNEPSGGGRSVPQHRRLYLPPTNADEIPRMSHDEGGPLRRTRIRRSPAELAAMRTRIGCEAREMLDPGVVAYPTPGPDHCRSCPFVDPCLAMIAGGDAERLLHADYRRRGPDDDRGGRLGSRTWSVGRGAAPPKFGARP